MKIISIETDRANSAESFHTYLKDSFEFPEYYGKNLDALYDCLTSISEYTTIIIPQTLAEMFDGYGVKIMEVFKDAVDYNEYLLLHIV